MRQHRIAVYPGDGIGTEVTDEAVRALEAVAARDGGFRLDLERFPWGIGHWERTGRLVPEDFLEVLRQKDAILLGAVGWPARLPDHLTLEPLIRIRQTFDQYACVRPARLLPGVRSPLAGKGAREIDLVVVRENSEGEYAAHGGRVHRGSPEEAAFETAVHTRRGIERVLRFGFALARSRRRRLTLVTKSNAMRHGYVLWDEVLEALRAEHPDVAADKLHVDAAAMDFVRRPERFDVVVASNLFGDILTDLGGIIAGGLGLAPSANLNPDRLHPSLFEPVHGSAPDIAGKGIANPVAAILAGAMMLEWLGHPGAGTSLREAVERALREGAATPDLGGKLSTRQMGDRVLAALEGGAGRTP